MILIPISLTLLTLLGGMFLLAKTQKESLGSFFKYVSYFIIGVSFLALLGAAIGGAIHMHNRGRCPMCMMHAGFKHGDRFGHDRMDFYGRGMYHDGMRDNMHNSNDDMPSDSSDKK